MRNVNRIEIDLAAVAHNMEVLRRMVGPACAVCPVVKADAYGLGMTRIARCLVHAGADMLAVYTADQAAELFRGAVSGPVLVLMPLRSLGRADEVYRGLVCGRLHLAVHDAAHLDDLIGIADRFGLVIPLHLEVDTGMCRGGCNVEDAPDVLRRIAEHPRVELAGIYTHFASAESDAEMTRIQDDRFERLLAEQAGLLPPTCIVHAANTAATLRDRCHHKTMVRVGQAWAGFGPECLCGGPSLPEGDALHPAVTLRSELAQMKTIEAGATVGYGATWTARRRSIIGLVPLGYADGYPLSLSSGPDDEPRAFVAIRDDHGRRAHAPVVGRVNMDQITIDLTEVVASSETSDVAIGATVELISPDRAAPNHLVRLAAAAGTNPYELLCRLSPRLDRVYRQDPASIEVFSSARATAVAG